MQNILVAFGGRSVEHEISIITGVLAINSLDKSKYNVLPIYIKRNGDWLTGKELFDIDNYKDIDSLNLTKTALISGSNTLYLIRKNKIKPLKKIDCFLNCCHGGEGENGSLSGLIKMCGIASASPDVCSSAVAMDKAVTKQLVKALQIKTVNGLKISSSDYDKRSHIAAKFIEEKIKFPVIVKPARLGSSVGISTAYSKESLKESLALAFMYDEIVIVEKLLLNKREINCAAYLEGDNVVVSECEEPPLKSDFLTFEDKYLNGDKEKRQIPADIPKNISDEIKHITKQLYKRLNLNGIVRADFLIENGEVYFNELNTVPGSLAYYLFASSVEGLGELLDIQIKTALEKKDKENQLLTDFAGEVLSSLAKNGSKCLKKR